MEQEVSTFKVAGSNPVRRTNLFIWHKENYTGDIENLYASEIKVYLSLHTAPMRGIFTHSKGDKCLIELGMVEKLV